MERFALVDHSSVRGGNAPGSNVLTPIDLTNDEAIPPVRDPGLEKDYVREDIRNDVAGEKPRDDRSRVDVSKLNATLLELNKFLLSKDMGVGLPSPHSTVLVDLVHHTLSQKYKYTRQKQIELFDDFLVLIRSGKNHKFVNKKLRDMYEIVEPNIIEERLSHWGNLKQTAAKGYVMARCNVCYRVSLKMRRNRQRGILKCHSCSGCVDFDKDENRTPNSYGNTNGDLSFSDKIKLRKLNDLIEAFEFIDVPFVRFHKALKKLGITKKHISKLATECPLSTLICTRNFHTNYLLRHIWVDFEGKLSIPKDPEFENIYLFGKKKKRPGGKYILFLHDRGDKCDLEYVSRDILNSESFRDNWVMFYHNGYLMAATPTQIDNWCARDELVSYFFDNEFVEYVDVSRSDEEDPNFEVPIVNLLSDIREGYCRRCGFVGHNLDRCRLELKPPKGDYNVKDKEFEYTAKEYRKMRDNEKFGKNMKLPSKQFVKKNLNAKGLSASDSIAMNSRCGLDTIEKNVIKSKFIANGEFDDLLGKDDPEALMAMTSGMDDKFLSGEFDDDEQAMYNKMRTDLLVVVGRIPRIENFKLPDMTNLTISAILLLLMKTFGISILPALGLSLGSSLVLPLASTTALRQGENVGLFKNVFYSTYMNLRSKLDLNNYFHEVQTWKLINVPDNDLNFDGRPDENRRTKLYHSDPRIAEFKVTTELKPKSGIIAEFLDFLIKNSPNRVLKWLGFTYNGIVSENRKVSLEMVSQLLMPRIAPYNYKLSLNSDRIHKAGNSLIGTNYDKDGLIYDQDVVGNSISFSIVLHAQRRKEQKATKRNGNVRMNRVIRGYRNGEVHLPNLPDTDDRAFIKTKKHYKEDPMKRPALGSQLLVDFPYCKFKGDPSHVPNIKAGFLKRMAHKLPKIDMEKLRRLKEFNMKVMRVLLKPIPRESDTRFESWLAKTPYSEKRKQQLRDVYYSSPREVTPSMRKVEGFVKDEDYDDPKVLRLIYPRTDEFKVKIGPYTKLMEELVYKLKYFVKHIPVAERPEWISTMYRKGARYMQTDYVSFESHFIKLIMEACEFPLYEYLLSELPEGKEIYDMMVDVLGGINFVDMKDVAAVVEQRRMSGEMTTSLANGWTNLIMTLFIMDENGVDWMSVDTRDEGDDGLTRIDSYCPTEKDYADLGFTIKIEMFDNLNEASFCGMVYDIDERIVVKDPRSVLAGLFWTGRKYSNASDKVLKSLLRSKSLSLLYTYPSCPVLYSVAKWLVRATEGYQYDIEYLDSYKRELFMLNKRYHDAHPEMYNRTTGNDTRNLVEKLYGISVAEQLMIEKYFDDKGDDLVIDCPELDNVMPQKYADFYDRFTEVVNVLDEEELMYTRLHFGYDPSLDTYKFDSKNDWDLHKKHPVIRGAMLVKHDRRVQVHPTPKCDIVEDDSDSCELGFKDFVYDHFREVSETIKNTLDECVGENSSTRSVDRSSDSSDVTDDSFDKSWEELSANERFLKHDEHLLGVRMNILFDNLRVNIKRLRRHIKDGYNCAQLFVDVLMTLRDVYGICRVAVLTTQVKIQLLIKLLWRRIRRGNGNDLVRGFSNPTGKIIIDLINKSSDFGDFNLLEHYLNMSTTVRKIEEIRKNKGLSKKKKRVAIRRLRRAGTTRRSRRILGRGIVRRRGRRFGGGRRRFGGKIINMPTAKGGIVDFRRPSFNNERNGTIVLEHTEFLYNVQGVIGDFSVTSFPIQPGLPSTFAFASSLAGVYESYSIEKLEVIYTPMCATTTTGFVVIAMDYDAEDPPPGSKLQVLAGPSTTGPPWQPMKHVCEFANLHKYKQFFIRGGDIASEHDIKTYDAAVLNVCTGGNGGSLSLGEIRLHYKIRFMTPQANQFSTNAELTSSTMSNGVGITATNTLGTVANQSVSANVRSLLYNLNTVFTNQAGNYLTFTQWLGTALGTLAATAGGGAIIHYASDALNASPVRMISSIAWTAVRNNALPSSIQYLFNSMTGGNNVLSLSAPYIYNAESSFYVNEMNRIFREESGNMEVYMFGHRIRPKLLNVDSHSKFRKCLFKHGLVQTMQQKRISFEKFVFLENNAIAQRYQYLVDGEWVESSQIRDKIIETDDGDDVQIEEDGFLRGDLRDDVRERRTGDELVKLFLKGLRSMDMDNDNVSEVKENTKFDSDFDLTGLCDVCGGFVNECDC